MAIREVLVSFTFEQQRQMLNLIGADVGDASLLLTPTNVVVTAINEIITGDVDLTNQTIGMDDGTLASPSLYWDTGQGFYKVDANKLGLTTSLAVTGNLEVDGDITFRAGSGTGGTLTFGDLDTDNIVLNAELQSSIVPDSTANYNLGSATKQWNNLWIDGTAAIDTLTVDENATIVGNLTIDSGNVYVPLNQTTVNLFDGTATDVNAFGDSTAIRIGATTGTLTLRNPTIIGTETTQNLFNTVSTTVNAFGVAEEIFMGVTLGGAPGSNSNFTINSDDTILIGDLNVNGGEILSSQNTFDLLINNSDVRIGSAAGTGTTVINNSLLVKGNFDIATSAVDMAIVDNSATALDIKEGSNSYLTFSTADTAERIIAHKDFYVTGNLYVDGTETIINTTTLSIDDKQIVLGDVTSPTDALADNGGILLQGTSSKTITYNASDNIWDLNIGAKINGNTIVRSSGALVSLDVTSTSVADISLIDRTNDNSWVVSNRGDGNFKLMFESPTDTFADKLTIASTGNATFAGALTSNGITQYALPTIANGGQLGYDDGTKSLRLYANSSTSADAKVQFHFNQSATAGITFDQSGAISFTGQTDTAATGATTSGTGLDHYEEGTWSPDFLGLSSAFTSYSNKVGTYVRIGSVCHIHGFIQLSGTPVFTTPDDPLRLGPLPFNFSNQNAGYYTTAGGVGCQSFNYHDNDYNNTGQVACGIVNNSGTSYVAFQVSGNNNIRGIVQNSAIGSTNCIIEFQLSYRV